MEALEKTNDTLEHDLYEIKVRIYIYMYYTVQVTADLTCLQCEVGVLLVAWMHSHRQRG